MNIPIETIVSVYDGENGRCCCGCSGKYSYSSRNTEAGTKRRGYTVTDDEISDYDVERIALLFKYASDSEIEAVCDNKFALVKGERLYMINTLEALVTCR